MPIKNAITDLFGIRYPIIQGGMIWCSGWQLASAVSNAGGLGLIGAGSMYPEVLREHIMKCKAATSQAFGVNIPLLYPEADQLIEIILNEKVPVVFTSAGSPAKYTTLLKNHGVKVAHVVANTKFARKAVDAGVDALVAEGFEAGGHNGLEETTTMTLIPLIREITDLPLIAAGGIATGSQMMASMALGADGVQIGSLFAASAESSAHPHFKQRIVEASEGSTMLMLKKLVPVRLLHNDFADKVKKAEDHGAGREALKELLGRGRAKAGMFEGELSEGELEIGQSVAFIRRIETVADIFDRLLKEYDASEKRVLNMNLKA